MIQMSIPRTTCAKNLRNGFPLWTQVKLRTLIIDIRGNGGGEETLGTLLFSYLEKDPFLYYKATLANGPDLDFLRYAEGPEERAALPRYIAPLKTPLNENLPGKPTARYELVNRPISDCSSQANLISMAKCLF